MDTSRPLEGITVVELGTSVAAPVAGMILAELGATVVKIENPAGGDDARGWGPPFDNDVAPVFQALNRNKRSAAVDLKNSEQRAALRRFIASDVDVVLQNLRPGLVDAYGLDAKSLCTENPRLIYCNLSAFGAVGPLKMRPGYDSLMQACAGIMSITGHPGEDPVRVGPSIVDQGAGMWCAIGILAALMRQSATGDGCIIDTSLYETSIAWMHAQIANLRLSGKVPSKMGSENAGFCPYRGYEADGGWIVIAAGNDNLFRKLSTVVGRSEWVTDARFLHNADRVRNRSELNSLLADVIRTNTPGHWLSKLDAAGVPCAPVLTLDAVIAEPQFATLGMLQAAADGGRPLVGLPLSFNGVRPPLLRSAPALGEGTNLVLQPVAAERSDE